MVVDTAKNRCEHAFYVSMIEIQMSICSLSKGCPKSYFLCFYHLKVNGGHRKVNGYAFYVLTMNVLLLSICLQQNVIQQNFRIMILELT